MKRFKHASAYRLVVIALFAFTILPVSAQKLTYPVAKKGDQVDTYFGKKVDDPYRWLEDENSSETAAWVEAENKVTFGYLDKIPFRTKVKERLEALYNYPKYSAPFQKGEYIYYYKNNGLQNQSVLYRQKGLDGVPEVVIDPNTWSTDGTSRLAVFELSKNGDYAGYGISLSGSDWQQYRVMDMKTLKPLPDSILWVKVSNFAWQGTGFYYSRYDAPEPGKERTSKNENHKVYYHKLGTTQAQDELIYQDPAHPQRFHFALTTRDERFVTLTISERGKGTKGNALFYRDASKTGGAFLPIVETIGDDNFNVVDNDGDTFILRTDHDAPNGKIVRYDPSAEGASRWRDLVPQKDEPLQGVGSAGGKLFLTYTKDVLTKAYVFDMKGAPENEIPLPDLGTASGFDGERDGKDIFYTFTSFTFPPTIYRYELATKKSTLFRGSEIPGYDPGAYVTKQVFYKSKDGTRVPMFIVHKKGLQPSAETPALLYAYGGFNISVPPSFSSLRLALLEQGFVYASANLRGGGEYGESWHEAGTKLKKQNVFDDFIAAAEWLIENKYTSAKKLAVQGGSNGGLLVGAVVNQRPDLFRVAIPQVGVMDMLRFHKFTIGWNWIPDYGSSDNEAEFNALSKYSPYHNLKAGITYPATLITTADHDDRVVPAHSFKYAAALQEKSDGTRPTIIRIETKSGHGASSVTKSIEVTADIYSFIMHNLGLVPAIP